MTEPERAAGGTCHRRWENHTPDGHPCVTCDSTRKQQGTHVRLSEALSRCYNSSKMASKAVWLEGGGMEGKCQHAYVRRVAAQDGISN